MSVYKINYNNGAKMMRPVLTREEYMNLRNSAKQQALLKAVREGKTEEKRHLVQMNYSCMPNPDGSLKGTKTMSTTVGMDIDHIKPEEMEAVKQRVLNNKVQLGLLMLEVSARGEGYHLVFKRKAEMTQEENLKWASDLLGVKYDEGAKDITRVFFTTTAAELLYLEDTIFENKGIQEVQDASLVQEVQRVPVNVNVPVKVPVAPVAALQCCSSEYAGHSFADIISKYWELFNDGKQPVEGDRNVKTYELAMTLRSICGYKLEQLLAVIPNYWGKDGEAEWRQTIENALKEPKRGMPYRLKQVLEALKSNNVVKACGGTLTTPPPMPKRLPKLIKLLTKNVPDLYKPAVASAVFPALGAHLHGVKFRYWDNAEHEATFMNVLIGRQSVGKGSIKKPIEYIMEDIRQRDLPNRQREAEWKQQNPTAKQKKDPRPKDICIQMLIDNLTDAVFNQRLVDAHNNGERFLYTIVDEIEALKKVTSRNNADEVGLLIRKAFDNAMAGQERVGADSVSGIAPLRWNFNASTTPPNAHRFFYKMVNDGTLSRLDISTIIVGEGNEDFMPVMGIYDQTFAQELKPYIDRLEAANGLIECPQARKLALDICKENSDKARLFESDAYFTLSKRAAVIAWLKGMVLYVAQGYQWDKTIADFMRWSEQYDLWCKMLYFGKQLEGEMDEEKNLQRQSGPQNLLQTLPDEFSREQYLLMRQQHGKQGDGKATLRSWMHRGYIVYDEVVGNYCKTKDYKAKFEV